MDQEQPEVVQEPELEKDMGEQDQSAPDEHLNGLNGTPDYPEMVVDPDVASDVALPSGEAALSDETAPEALNEEPVEAAQSAEETLTTPSVEDADVQVPSDDGADADTLPNLDATAPLPASASAIEQEELTPLPANAVVTGKYIVQSQLHHSPERNLYRVAPRRQQKCGTCGRLSSVDARNCEHCGAALSKEAPSEFYLMAESFQPESLIQDPTLMDLRLYHP